MFVQTHIYTYKYREGGEGEEFFIGIKKDIHIYTHCLYPISYHM